MVFSVFIWDLFIKNAQPAGEGQAGRECKLFFYIMAEESQAREWLRAYCVVAVAVKSGLIVGILSVRAIQCQLSQEGRAADNG